MTYWQSALYGVVQGLTEFFPISSSAHLYLLGPALQIEDPGVYFDFFMHVATALAVLIFYFPFLTQYLVGFWKFLTCPQRGATSPHKNYALFVANYALTLLVTFVAVLALKDWAPALGRQIPAVACNLALFGALLWWADKKARQQSSAPIDSQLTRDRALSTLGPLASSFQWKMALLIGLTQALALFPGVSRSGITITVALLLGLPRESSFHFSFLLALPLILGGALLSYKEFQAILGSSEAMPLSVVLFGFFISLVVGLLALKYFLRAFGRFGLFPFFIYRVALAALLLIFAL